MYAGAGPRNCMILPLRNWKGKEKSITRAPEKRDIIVQSKIEQLFFAAMKFLFYVLFSNLKCSKLWSSDSAYYRRVGHSKCSVYKSSWRFVPNLKVNQSIKWLLCVHSTLEPLVFKKRISSTSICACLLQTLWHFWSRNLSNMKKNVEMSFITSNIVQAMQLYVLYSLNNEQCQYEPTTDLVTNWKVKKRLLFTFYQLYVHWNTHANILSEFKAKSESSYMGMMQM